MFARPRVCVCVDFMIVLTIFFNWALFFMFFNQRFFSPCLSLSLLRMWGEVWISHTHTHTGRQIVNTQTFNYPCYIRVRRSYNHVRLGDWLERLDDCYVQGTLAFSLGSKDGHQLYSTYVIRGNLNLFSFLLRFNKVALSFTSAFLFYFYSRLVLLWCVCVCTYFTVFT